MEIVHAADHFGQKRTMRLLMRNFYWKSLPQDARKFCSACLVCQRAKASNQPREHLEKFDLTGVGPGDLVAIDIATLPWTDGGFRYFLCMVDMFSRFIELV